MTRLQNFVLGATVAFLLMGPTAWAVSRNAVAHTESFVVAALTGPAHSGAETARITVHSAILPKS